MLLMKMLLMKMLLMKALPMKALLMKIPPLNAARIGVHTVERISESAEKSAKVSKSIREGRNSVTKNQRVSQNELD